MNKSKVLIFIVAYNHEHFIEAVLNRIPENVWENDNFETEILIIDDQSTDLTFVVANEYIKKNKHRNITVFYNPKNLGYGGNQKIGYQYAIKKGFDVVVLLHGDGQYAPEFLENMILPIVNGEADVVLGSRMLDKKAAIQGKMPPYKWIGNIVLTSIQNLILGVKFAEFHTGYRAYRVSALDSIPFRYNSDYYDFDTDILIQLIDNKKQIKEIPIPTYYGEEISRVRVFKYGILILSSTLQSRLMKFGLFYHPKFDYEKTNTYYSAKTGYPSSHRFALDHIKPGSKVLNLGCGPGYLEIELASLDVKTISIDLTISDIVRDHAFKTIEADVESLDFQKIEPVDSILILDLIEHLRTPEGFLISIRDRFCREKPEIIITTGNIAFLPIRLMLLIGKYNYGKRGILDITHTRLFTFKSMRAMLNNYGFEILSEVGIPAPFPLAFGERRISYILLKINQFFVKLSRGLFSYQMGFVVSPKPTVDLLLENAQRAKS